MMMDLPVVKHVNLHALHVTDHQPIPAYPVRETEFQALKIPVFVPLASMTTDLSTVNLAAKSAPPVQVHRAIVSHATFLPQTEALGFQLASVKPVSSKQEMLSALLAI
jgi:hypothetical protein